MAEAVRLRPDPRLNALIAAAVGAAAFKLAHMPLPLLLGPMMGCLVAALLGVPLRGIGRFSTMMRTFVGVAIGSTITVAMLAELPMIGPSLLLVPVYVLLIGVVGYPLMRRGLGFDHPTAFYSAMPGGLQDMLIFGEEAGGNVRAMSLIHATRVLAIVTVAPLLLTRLMALDLTRPPGVAAASLPLWEIALMAGSGVVGLLMAERLRLFGAAILGPLLLTAALSLSGVITSRPPAEMIWVSQFFIGTSVGTAYAGITSAELRRFVTAGLLYSALLAAISLAFVELVRQVSSAGSLDILLAFLPGGQSEMAVVALVAGADVAFVVVHHLARVLLVILCAPIVARLLARR